MAEKRTRKVLFPITDDPAANVKGKATQRLNAAIKAVESLGNCCGKDYAWTEEQIEHVDKELLAVYNSTLDNLKRGSRPTAKIKVQL